MKRVLLAVCGLAPQVLTETLYGLHQQNRLPSIVRVISTRPGVDACLSQLFGPQGAYPQFLKDYQVDAESIDFSSQSLKCVNNVQGHPLGDICEEDDNRCFLRACMQAAFELSREPETTIFYSIAGGRKTMGSCLSLAAQLYGRPQDRIYHVLVSPEFESCRDFFYPPPQSRLIQLYDSKQQPYQKESCFAQIRLITMPFFSLRERITDPLLQQAETPATLMASLVIDAKPQLQIDMRGRKVIWKTREADLPPSLLALYAFFAELKKTAQCELQPCVGCSECYLDLPQILKNNNLDRIAQIYQQIRPERELVSMSSTGIGSLSAENFNSTRSKLNKQLEEAYGSYEKNSIQLDKQGQKPGVRYGLHLSRQQITLSW